MCRLPLFHRVFKHGRCVLWRCTASTSLPRSLARTDFSLNRSSFGEKQSCRCCAFYNHTSIARSKSKGLELKIPLFQSLYVSMSRRASPSKSCLVPHQDFGLFRRLCIICAMLRVLAVLALAQLAAGHCFYNAFGQYVCSFDDAGSNNTAARARLGIGCAADEIQRNIFAPGSVACGAFHKICFCLDDFLLRYICPAQSLAL